MASEGSLRIPEMEKLCAGLHGLKDLELKHFEANFTERAMTRGTLYSMEPGWIDNVKLVPETEEGCVQVEARCWASFEKTTRRRVYVKLEAETLLFKDSFCACVAGLNTCSHASGLLQYLAFLARYIRAVEVETDGGEENPCTSEPRKWGVPSQRRAICPTVPLDKLNLGEKPKPLECFSPLKSDSDAETVQPSKRSVAPLVSLLIAEAEKSNISMSFVPYFTHVPLTPTPCVSPFNGHRMKALRLPARFEELWKEQQKYLEDNTDATPSIETLQRWKAIFLRCLYAARPTEIETGTRGQASSDDWFLERICRLTASKCKDVCSRQRDFKGLCKQLLYKSPPTLLAALDHGRRKEPEAVQRYTVKFPDRNVSDSGLVVKEDAQFIAATPDRLVSDPQASEKEGLIEVKCPFATSDTPQVTATKKKGFFLKEQNGTLRLDRNNRYYYQVQCQLACTRRQWCDFVVYCKRAVRREDSI